MHTPSTILIIQTAFIGDVILATGLVEKLSSSYPKAKIDFLLRKGNEDLLKDHPKLRSVLIWNKKEGKIKNLVKLTGEVRNRNYDCVINVHRFGSSGLITAFSGSHLKIGFDKNPFSIFFDKKIRHVIGSLHEIERNQMLIESITDQKAMPPRLYPSMRDEESIKQYLNHPFVCIAPTSVWFTKQFPSDRWVELIRKLGDVSIYLLGAPSDIQACETIRIKSNHERVVNLAGKLSFLQSAALMRHAKMNYVNDSAPMHLASSVNAPVTAVYCSTVPAFGFGPLSQKSFVIESKEKLDCRPCGLHGHKACPKGHFNCATTISIQALAECLTK